MTKTHLDAKFFATPAQFRKWLDAHHGEESELWVGFHKKGTGKPSITWPESVDEALCVGWIDGVRKSIDEESYAVLFTPRKATSTWSAVNMKRMAELEKEERMRPAGREAFERRSEKKSGIYAYEQRENAQLDEGAVAEFKTHGKAWAYFEKQPPWYRKTASWWVVSAKREETRQKRLAKLIECSAQGRPIPQLDRQGQGHK
jgi:uncharacterized protein YdeI (YjbR/CyaY-like superfamily)